MGKERVASASGKRKQAKGPVLNGESQVTAGGELHQIAGGEHPALTTNQGVSRSPIIRIRSRPIRAALHFGSTNGGGCYRRPQTEREGR